jgi:hypothetical protein
MAEEDKKPTVGARRKKNNYNQFGGKPFPQSVKVMYMSNVVEIKDNTFHVDGSSNPAKYSKLLKSIKTYIQRTYKMPDNIVKGIQNMIRPSFNPPEKPDKSKCLDNAGRFDLDEFEMAKFTWKEGSRNTKKTRPTYGCWCTTSALMS